MQTNIATTNQVKKELPCLSHVVLIGDRRKFLSCLVTLKLEVDNVQDIIYYRVSQKNALSECCWSHSALAQSQVAGTLCVLRLIFWLFLTNTKPEQAFQSQT